MDINTNLTAIKGIGEKTAGLFSKLHIGTVGQLLEHYPRDYERMEPAVTVSALSPGESLCGKGVSYRNAFHQAGTESVDHCCSGRGCDRPFSYYFFWHALSEKYA